MTIPPPCGYFQQKNNIRTFVQLNEWKERDREKRTKRPHKGNTMTMKGPHMITMLSVYTYRFCLMKSAQFHFE